VCRSQVYADMKQSRLAEEDKRKSDEFGVEEVSILGRMIRFGS